MAPRQRWSGRAGFTLVEVALSVAVALIVLGGAITGYNAVKDTAASATARKRVDTAGAMVIEYSSMNFGRFPDSVAGATGGSFTAMWGRKFPDEYNKSPWGGSTSDTDGAIEFTPFANAAGTAAAAPDNTSMFATDQTQAANMMYVSITGNGYVKLQQLANPDAYLCRGFVLGIYDRSGQPWFHLATNK